MEGSYSNFWDLFLGHINDLPLSVDSKSRLFADDCLIYREINSIEDKVQLQKDLDSLQDWAENWGMRFNAQKCYILSSYSSKTDSLFLSAKWRDTAICTKYSIQV